MLKENWKVNGLIVALSGLTWVVSFLLQGYFLPSLSRAPGIDLFFIPSGVRLIAIMIGGIWAAVGVFLGSLFLAGPEFQTSQPWVIIAIAAGSGLFPYLALRGSLWAMGLDDRLTNLTAAKLPFIGLGVAFVSSVLHNLLFSTMGLDTWPAFAGNVLTMITGDFVGILLAVLIVFVILRIYRRPAT